MLSSLNTDYSNFVKMRIWTYIHLHIAITIHIHRDISIQIHSSKLWYLKLARFTLLGIYLSTYDNFHRRIDLYIISSTWRCIDIYITNYMKRDLTTFDLMSVVASIDRNQITSSYINRDSSIQVEMS